MTIEEFTPGLMLIKGGTGHKFDDPVQVKAWFFILGDSPSEAWNAAVYRTIAEHDGGFPSPGVVKGYVDEFVHGVEIGHDEAFESVIKAIHRFGYCDVKSALDSFTPLTAAAVRALGGFKSLCDMKTADRSFFKAQFRDAYQAAQKVKVSQRKLPENVRPRLQSEENQKLITSVAKKIGVTE